MAALPGQAAPTRWFRVAGALADVRRVSLTYAQPDQLPAEPRTGAGRLVLRALEAGDAYTVVRAMVGLRFSRGTRVQAAMLRWFRRGLRCSPSLQALEDRCSGMLSDNFVRLLQLVTYRMPVFLFAALLLYLVLLAGVLLETVNAAPLGLSDSAYRGALFGTVAILYLAEIMAIRRILLVGNEWSVAWRLVRVIRLLESRPDCWRDLSFRRRVNRQLEGVSRALERLPAGMGISRIELRRELVTLARSKAEGIGELQRWVAQPGPFTFTDLLERLTSDLELVVAGRWFELPDSAHPLTVHASRTRRAAVAALAATLMLGTIAVIGFGSQFGPATTALSTTLGMATIAVLGRLGVSAEQLKLASEVSASLDRPAETTEPKEK